MIGHNIQGNLRLSDLYHTLLQYLVFRMLAKVQSLMDLMSFEITELTLPAACGLVPVLAMLIKVIL